MYLVNSSDECNYFIFINGSRCIGHWPKLELSCLGHFPNSLATSSLKLKHTVCLISVQIIAAHDEDLSLVQQAGDWALSWCEVFGDVGNADELPDLLLLLAHRCNYPQLFDWLQMTGFDDYLIRKMYFYQRLQTKLRSWFWSKRTAHNQWCHCTTAQTFRLSQDKGQASPRISDVRPQ